MAPITIIQMPFFNIFADRSVKTEHFIIDFDCCFNLAGAKS